MEGVPIDKDTLAQFKNGAAESPPATVGPDSESEDVSAAIKGIDKSLKWLIDRVDKSGKSAGGSGIGDEEFREDYRELCMINVKEMAKDMQNTEFLKKSPRYMFYLITAGLLAENGVAIYRNGGQKSDSEQQEDPE